MPAASIAAATVSPMRARIGLPSTLRVKVAPMSPSLLNMKPPRAEGSDQRLVEDAARDHRCHGERMIGRKRDARMAAQHEGAGMSGTLVVDRKPVLGHDSDRTPGAHHVRAGEQREEAHGALGLGGADAQR